MNNSIDTAVADYVVKISLRDSQTHAQTLYVTGSEDDVVDLAHKAFPENKYTIKYTPAREISPGVYCLGK